MHGLPATWSSTGQHVKRDSSLFLNTVSFLLRTSSIRWRMALRRPGALTQPGARGRCLTQMGTAKESFVELTERIGRKTGGLAASPLVADVRGEREPAAYLMVSGKAMAGKAGDLFELFRDILLTARLDDRERFKQARRSAASVCSACYRAN